MEKKIYLTIINIYFLICGIILLLVGLVIGLLLAASIKTITDTISSLSGKEVMLMFASFMYVVSLLISGIFYIPMGILELKHRKKPEKAKQIKELGIIGIILSIIVFVISLFTGAWPIKVWFFVNIIIMAVYYYIADHNLQKNKN